MKDKVSVIVPIYKVERYLNKCIDSIINQTYSNLEIILVDDGSPDRCPEICDEYSNKDSRIKVVHQKNGGLSDARNTGIKYSTGEWLTFVDSDDYLTPDYISSLLHLSDEDYDIGIVLPIYVDENGKILKSLSKKNITKIYSSVEAIFTLMYQKYFDTSAWGKIYRRDVFYDVEFPVGQLYEDINTIYRTFYNAKKIVYKSVQKYYYVQRNTSIMGEEFKIKDMDYVFEAKKILSDARINKNHKLLKAAKCRFVNANFSILLKIKKTPNNKEIYKKEIELLHDNIKEYSVGVLFDVNSRFKTKSAIILNYFGLL